MGKVVSSVFGGKPKKPTVDPQIAAQLAAVKAAEAKRLKESDAKKAEEAAQLKRNKRGRRSLFAENNAGSGFEEIEKKKKSLA